MPYARYGETPEATLAAIGAMRGAVRERLDRAALQSAMPAGAARNALDCALLDLEAKTRGPSASGIARLRAADAGDHRLHDLARHARRRWQPPPRPRRCGRCSR